MAAKKTTARAGPLHVRKPGALTRDDEDWLNQMLACADLPPQYGPNAPPPNPGLATRTRRAGTLSSGPR